MRKSIFIFLLFIQICFAQLTPRSDCENFPKCYKECTNKIDSSFPVCNLLSLPVLGGGFANGACRISESHKAEDKCRNTCISQLPDACEVRNNYVTSNYDDFLIFCQGGIIHIEAVENNDYKSLSQTIRKKCKGMFVVPHYDSHYYSKRSDVYYCDCLHPIVYENQKSRRQTFSDKIFQ